jgi:hypothetical protein
MRMGLLYPATGEMQAGEIRLGSPVALLSGRGRCQVEASEASFIYGSRPLRNATGLQNSRQNNQQMGCLTYKNLPLG